MTVDKAATDNERDTVSSPNRFLAPPGSQPMLAATRSLRHATFAALFVASSAAAAEPLAHMVFFTMADDTAVNRERLVEGCRELLDGHEGTLYFSVGERVEDLDRDVNDNGFDVAVHLVFESRAAHDAYQVNPRHLRFIDENKELWSAVRVFDSYLAGHNAVGAP